MGPYVLTALRARELHKRDVQYIVRDGEVKIVNRSTGRVLPKSRWMDDLHQVWLWPLFLALLPARVISGHDLKAFIFGYIPLKVACVRFSRTRGCSGDRGPGAGCGHQGRGARSQ